MSNFNPSFFRNFGLNTFVDNSKLIQIHRRYIGNIPFEPFINKPVPSEIKKVLGLNFRKEFSLFLKRIDVPVYGVYAYFKLISTNFESQIEIDRFHSNSIRGYFMLQHSIAIQLNKVYSNMLPARVIEKLVYYLSDRENILRVFKNTGLLDFYVTPFEDVAQPNKIRHYVKKPSTFDQYQIFLSRYNLNKVVPYYDDNDAMIDTLFGILNLIHYKHGQTVIDRFIKNFVIPGLVHFDWKGFCEDFEQSTATIEAIAKIDYVEPKVIVHVVEDSNPILIRKPYTVYTAFLYINEDLISSASHKKRDKAIAFAHNIALVTQLNNIFNYTDRTDHKNDVKLKCSEEKHNLTI